MSSYFKDINAHILGIFSDARDVASPQDLEEARRVIDKLRETFSAGGEQLGLWETAELNYADHAINAGFLRLAMISAVKAISIHQLSDEEYAFGFCLVGAQHKSFMHIGEREKKVQTDLKETRKEAARILKSNQEFAAQALADQERLSANKLRVQQEKEAWILDKHNVQAAERLKASDLNEIEGLSIVLDSSRRRLNELEELLLLLSGGYSVQSGLEGRDVDVFFSSLSEQKELAADGLKKDQAIIAADLRVEQQEKAKLVKAGEEAHAKELKRSQSKSATDLRDSQTIKNLRKNNKDVESKS